MSIETEQFLTVKEVASYLRLSPQSVYRMIHSHELDAIKAGRTYRVFLRSANEWLTENTTRKENHHGNPVHS